MRKVIRSNPFSINLRKLSLRFPHLERMAYSLIVFLLLSGTALQGQSIFITSSGGSFPTERYLSISTAVDGGGTIIWEQGDYCGNSGLGNVSDVEVDVTTYCGQTIFVNAYDKYDDTWNSGTYEIWTEAGQTGTLLANNGGASPDDGNDDDGSSTPCDIDQATELEVSEGFAATACLCTKPTIGTATAVTTNCNMGTFDVSLEITTAGEGSSVTISDGNVANDQVVTTFPITVTFTGYAGGASVTLNADNGMCNIDANVVTESCACTTAPTGTAVVNTTDCGTGMFHVDVTVSTLGDAAAVTVSDGTTTDDNGGAGYAATATVQMGPYAAGASVTITLAGLTWTSCSTDLPAVTEDCTCTTMPTATVTSGNLDCITNMYDITVTVDSDGSGDVDMSDVFIDGALAAGGMNVITGAANVFTVALGSHTVTIEAEGSSFNSCTSLSYPTDLSCNGGDICEDAVDILGSTSSCDLSTAVNEDITNLTPCFETVGNGTTLGKGDCNGEGCAEHSAYYYTEYKDIWYVIDLPDGVDEFSVNFTGLTCNVVVFPYTSTCGSLSLMDVTGGVGTGLADADNDGVIETEANDNPFINTDGAIHFKGADVATASTAPIYLRIFAHDDNASGTACSTADIVNCSFTIGVTSPQPNDVCNDGLIINSYDDDILTDDTYLPVTQSGDISAANADSETSPNSNGTSCGVATMATGEEDLWYSIKTPASGNYFVELDIDFTGPEDELYVVIEEYCSSGTVIGCESISADGTVVFDGDNLTNFDTALTPGNIFNVKIVLPTGSSASTFDISAKLIAENNSCDIHQETFPGFGLPASGSTPTEVNMNFASDSGANPSTPGTDLWYHFDPMTSTDGYGFTTGSTTVEIVVGGLDEANNEQLTILLYKGNTVSANNCTDLAGDYLETLVVNSNSTVELACLDELHTSVDGGYLVRVVQTGGSTVADEVTLNADPQPAGPMNNDCENIWNGSGPTILGATGEDVSTSFNPYVILPGFSNYRSGDFENTTDCHPDIASAICNGVDQQAIASNEDRDLWYVITVPDLAGACDLAMSETITGVTFLYNAGDQTEDAVLYLYDGCNDSNLIGCSGSLDGAPSGAGDAQFDDPQSTWTVSDLVQGNSYLLRIKPHDISNNGNANEFDFDISWRTADPSPCNDDPANAEALTLGCYSYSELDTWSAQGATETAPVDGAPESDVWFSFTAPAANGGSYTTTESWASVFFENVSGHNLFLDIYNTISTSPTVTTYETGGTAGDQGWGIFGNLDPGATYYLRLYHKELPTVNVQYKIAVNDGPVTEPGWGCGSNSQSMINECASGCKDLREVFFKIDLPTDAPTDSYWAIEVTGMDQDLDFELRSQYNNGQTTYVVGASGVDGALEGGAHDYDHPCSSVALESAVTISSTTTAIDGCDGNDTLGDIDPSNDTSSESANSDIGSGVRRVYHDMNGPGSASMKDYYFVRVFIDPADARYADWAEVKICDISFKGPYSTSALADAGGVPDRNCDPVTCAISNVVVSNDNTCNGDDATFTVTFDVSEGGGTYEVYDTDTDATLGTTTAAATATGVTIDVTVTGPTSGSTINIDVRDNPTNACNGGIPQSAILATCPNTTVAVDDFNNTPEGVTVTGNALDNDYDPQGDSQDVTTTITTNPTKGTVTIDALGNYTYIPTAGQTGEDSFEYTVCDDQTPEACDVATVYIEIIADPVTGNNPPIADPDYALSYADTPVMGSLISNDNDPDSDNLIVNTTPTSGPTNGILVINSDGTYTYTPNGGFTGMDMFMYEVCDDGTPSMCDITTMTIDVITDNGNNITSAADDSGVGLVNETITGDLVANDTDPDGDTQTINTTPVSGPSVAGASVTINTDGTYSYVPASDYVGNDEFMYEICDDAMPMIACVTATVHITVLPGKPNLTYAVDDFNHTPVNVTVTGNALSNDFDPDGQTQIAETTIVTEPTKGTVTILADGTYTYIPTTDETGEDSFEYTVCDDATPPACETATVYITIIADPVSGNDAPIANPDYSITEINTPILGNMISNDNDPDNDQLTVNTTPETMPTNGMVTIYPNGTYLYTPNTDYIGPDMFSYEVCDGDNVCDIATVSIDVLPDTGNITGAGDDSGIGVINTTIAGDLLDNDTDPEGDAQTINTTPVSDPTNGTVTIYPDGSYDYVPTTDFVGNDEFTYEVCDNGSPMACVEATVYLTILDLNGDPEYTIAFNTDGTSYLNGAIKDGYYVVENIGDGESLGNISLTFSIPNTSVFTTTFNATMATVDVNGGTPVDNSKFTYTTFSNFIFATLKSGETLAPGEDFKIGFTFTAIGSPLSTAGTTGQVQSFTAGDIIETNNYAQGSFRIN